MEKLTFWLLSTLFVLSACNSVDGLTPPASEGEYSLSVGVDKGVQTRANNLNDLVLPGYDLRYVLEIYHVSVVGETKTPTLYKRMVQLNDTKFNFRLVKDQTYEFLVWVDYSTTGSTADLHYATGQDSFTREEKSFAGGLRTVQMMGEYKNNDHSRDAFFGYVEIANIGKENTHVGDITCVRPFGQLNITTTDWNSFQNIATLTPTTVQINLTDIFTQFNVKTGEVSVPSNLSYDLNAPMAGLPTTDLLDPTTGAVALLQRRLLTCDYLFASSKTTQDIHTGTKLTFFNADGQKITDTGNDWLANLPIQRNHKTFVIGKMISRKGDLTIKVNESWDALSPIEKPIN